MYIHLHLVLSKTSLDLNLLPGVIAHDASAADVASQLNALASISPSAVTVSRDGPLKTGPESRGGNQVGGFIWSITFASNLWRDPTVLHFETGDYLPGNWIGDEASWTDKWPTGHSVEWGKNVGDMPRISCIDSGLYSTNGALPSDACAVYEVVKGTAPVGGFFRVTLNTLGHTIINRRGVYTSGYIRHNAVAGVVESSGDGTSMEEILEAMPNIGDVKVERSDVNMGGNNGGYTWTITFFRDAGASGAGQWGDCEQRDSVENLCNSPGNVPKFSGFDDSLLLGGCNSANGYACSRVTFLDATDGQSFSPPGTCEVQHFYVRDPSYVGFGTNESARASDTVYGNDAKKSYLIGFGGEYYESCLPYDATADQVRIALNFLGKISTKPATAMALANVTVTRHISVTDAPNAYFYRISFLGAGDVEDPEDFGGNGLSFNTTARHLTNADGFIKAGCNAFEPSQNISAETWIQGQTNPNNCSASRCVDGVVQRGNLTVFEVESDPLGKANLPWNADAEGSLTSIKSWLESSTRARRVVNVSREVYGRHGVLEWKVTFVYNEFEIPPGAGDIALLNVSQQAATDGVIYSPRVVESRKGTEGLSGYFEIDFESPSGPRRVGYNETASRFERKLEEMLTIGDVHVERNQYPSSSSGGWGDVSTDTTFGGLEWRVFFLKNPGSYNGHTFPPGAGNVDSITFDASKLVGDTAEVKNAVIRDGSTPFAGSFTLSYAGAATPTMEWQEAPDEIEYSLEQLSTIGMLRASRDDLAAVRIPGVSGYVSRDSSIVHLSYDSEVFGSAGTLESSLEDYLAPGELFRLGGADALRPEGSSSTFDGAAHLPALVRYSYGSPVIMTGDLGLTATLAPGQRLRIGGESYFIRRTGGEIQRLFVAADYVPLNATKVYRLSSVQSGSSQSTRCLAFHASADDIQKALAELDSFFDGVVVTRRGSGRHGDAYLYSIYFGAGLNSNSGRGDVRLLEVDSRECNDHAHAIPSASAIKNFANISGLDIGVNVVVEGGATEVQVVSLALDSGWLEGDYFRLRYETELTDCIEWGASAGSVQNALNKLSTLTDRLVDVTIDLRSRVNAGNTIRVSNSTAHWRRDLNDGRNRKVCFDGKVFAGDKLRFNGSESIFTVVAVSEDGKSLELLQALQLDAVYAVESAVLYVVEDRSVIVSKHGLGNGTAAVTVVQVVADAYLASTETDDPTNGLYKLQVTHDDVVRQTSCISFAATAGDVADAIEALRFDFNNDGLINDEGHIQVVRIGDGTASSGYGYEYRFVFRGPDNNREHHGFAGAQSTVLGANAPGIEVVSIGSVGGCHDAHGPENSLAVTATTKHNTTSVELSDDATRVLAPGDRIRIDGSEDKFQIYTVAATATYRGESWIELTIPFKCAASPLGCGSGRKVRRSSAGAPSFTVRNEVAGLDVWQYAVHFVGGHLSNVKPLEVVNEASGVCADSWAHYRGRARDVRVETVLEGGSIERQKLALSATMGKPSSGQYFVLYINHFIRVDAGSGGRCFGWDHTAEFLQRRIAEAFDLTYNLTELSLHNLYNRSELQIEVTRSGFGDASSSYGYEYQLDFSGDLVYGDYPPIFVLTKNTGLEDSTAYFNRFHLSGQNDCEFSGDFVHAPMSATYTIEITRIGEVDANSTVLSNDAYTLTRVVGTSVSTYFERECRTFNTMINLDAGGFDGIEFRFGKAHGHALGDTWVLQLYTCADSIPNDASIHVSTLFQGGIDPHSLTLETGLMLEGSGYVDAYLVPQMFTVREPETGIQTITVSDTIGNGWSQATQSAEPAYLLSLDSSFSNVSNCIPWNAEDFKVEAEIEKLISDAYGISNSVTVTRREDAVEAPNGYVYTVYFDGLVGVRAAPMIKVNTSNCTGVAFSDHDGERVEVDVLAKGAGVATAAFVRSVLPLGDADEAKNPGQYLGRGGASLPIYKLSGSYVTVAFDDALGDVEPIQIDASNLASGVSASVYDNVVRGNAATSYVIENILTGLPYFVRVAARNRYGYSEWSSPTAVGKPAAVPPKIEKVTTDSVLAKNEVQKVTLAALHVDEIQVIKTTADTIYEVQEVTVSAPFGGKVLGNICVFFPSAVVVTLSADSIIMSGSFRLNLTLPSADVVSGIVNSTIFTTRCIPFDATEDEFKDALGALQPIKDGDVAVKRSGTGGASSSWGYSWNVEFTGLIGVVPLLDATFCGPAPFVLGGGSANATVEAAADRYNVRGLATCTQIVHVVVKANARIVQGEFRILVRRGNSSNVQSTTCLNWDDDADVIEGALEKLSNVDSVRVIRHGSGSLSSHYGHVYEILFDGYAMQFVEDHSTAVANVSVSTQGCSVVFATEVYGVLEPFRNDGRLKYSIQVDVDAPGGASIDAKDDSPEALNEFRYKLERLPSLTDVFAQVETRDLSHGLTWTLTVRDPAGDIPTLSCVGDSVFEESDASCTVDTVIDGNVVSGKFVIAGSDPLPFDASATRLALALQETSAGSVEVSRSGPDAQLGYAWTVTFTGVDGDVNALDVVPSLTGNGAAVTVTTIREGNKLGGTFGLRTANGFATEQLPFNVTAAQLETALNLVAKVDIALGEVQVSRHDEVSTEGGVSYLVTFLTAAGDVPLLIAENFNLTGSGAAVSIREIVKGSETRGDKLAIGFATPRECSETQVTSGTCGEEVLLYEIQTSITASFTGTSLTTQDIQVEHMVQIVRIGASTFASEQYESPEVSGHFQLAYNGHTTVPLNAGVPAMTLRHALEALPGVGAIDVSRNYAPRLLPTATCTVTTGSPTIICASLSVLSAPQRSDLILLEDTWYRVGDTYDPEEEATEIPLALPSDSRIETSYQGRTDASVIMYGWSGGYEWRIEFIGNNAPTMLTSPEHYLVPANASVSVRPLDCDNCVYADGLNAFQLRYVRVRAVSALGPGPWSDVESAKPARVPDPPSQFSVEVTSGTSVRLYWHPPATISGEILGYSIQWDSGIYFDNARSADATCVSIGYGDCFIQGAAIQGTPPYDYTVNGLMTNVTYFFRIAARNELFDSLDETDGARWTEVLSARPANVPPLLPRNGVLYVAGRHKLQLRFEPPISDGGANITTYVVQYGTDSTFSSSMSTFNITAERAEKSRLYENGPIVAAIDGLQPGAIAFTCDLHVGISLACVWRGA